MDHSPRKQLRRSTSATRSGLALLLALATPGAASQGFRTLDDLLVGGAPDPDRSARDQVFAPDDFRAQVRLQLQLDRARRDLDARVRRARWIGSWKPTDRWAVRGEVDLDDEDVEVLDLYATYELRRWSRLWMGQFKSMLSRSYLSSSGGLLFTERPLAVRAFVDSDFQASPARRRDRLRGHGGGRVPRLRLTNYWYFDEGERDGDELGIRLRAEVSQGTSPFETSGNPAYTLRLEIHPDGNPSYTEGNLAAVRQVEQDLVLSRALVEIFSDGFLAERLALRGGTALHKLFLAPPRRYSEDIDLVQIQAEGAPVGETMDRLRALLSPWLGDPKYKVTRGMATQIYRFASEDRPPVPLRLKVETNYDESFSLLPLEEREFSVENRWFQGSASVRVNHPDELLATKLRALYQRRKGRDLFDLVVALDELDLHPDEVVRCFQAYLDRKGLRISRREYELNLEAKLATPAFLEDLAPLLPPGITHDPPSAASRVSETLLALLG